ncbi:integrase, catalytic region, zinc finger, CCHC-type containing protein [Tanacetum coccineum]
MACDVFWKVKLSTLHDENVLLKHQVESTVKERENIKLEFQRLFNSVKATRVQHQNEINEMVEKVNQKTYDYAEVRAQNQDLLMIISELKSKLRTIDKGKHEYTKFDKSETLGQLLCVTPFNKNLAIKAKNVSNTKGKSKKASLPPKLVPSTESKLELLHIDLYGPMRVTSINGKKYILVIVDDYQRNLKALILTIRTDNGTEFKNKKLRPFYAKLGIVYKTSIARTPQQNGVDERRNRTLVKAARTMLIFSKAPEFMWAEAIATACFTQNRSIMKSKADIGIFVGYSESSRGFCISNRLTKKIMEMIHVKFDELTAMAFECNNLEPGMNCANFNNSSEDSQSVPSTSDLDNLFGPMYEEYYATRSQEVSDNFTAHTLDNDHTSSSLNRMMLLK